MSSTSPTPAPSASPRSSVVGGRRAAARAAPAGSRRGPGRARPPPRARLAPWLLAGLAVLGLGASLTIQRWLGPPSDQVVATFTPPPASLIEAVQKDLSEDTPGAFHRAEARCEEAGARACQAEAILLRALRYGPDDVLLATASSLFSALEEARAWPDEGERRRVRALLALTHGDPEVAHTDLDGDRPRELLYRAWAALALGERDEAATIAARLLGATPGDPAAGLLAYEADPAAPLDDLRRLADAHREHPRIQGALLRALIDDGALVEADTRASVLASSQWVGSQWASASFRAGESALRAELLERRGQLTPALELYDQARAQAPGRRDLLLRRARLLLDAGDHTRLRGDLQADLGRLPGDPELIALLVELELRSGLPRAAEEQIERYLDADLDPGWEALLRGRVALARHEDDEALASFTRARELDPGLLDATLAEAELLNALDRRREASALLADARAHQPSRAARRRLLAVEVKGLIAADKRDLALEILDRALAEDPGNNEARIRRGVLRGELGLDDAARDDLLRVLERAGPITSLIGPLGREYLRAGDDRAAEALIAASVDDRRATPEVTLLAAELAFRRRDLATAENQVHRHLLRHAPEAWRGELLLAEILEARGELAEALVAVSRARPPRPDARVELVAGRLLEASERLPEALARYRRARHLEPRDEEARRRYVSALIAADQATEAIAELRPLVAAGGASPELERLLTRAELAAGQRREALERLDQRLAAAPDDREAMYWRGVVLHEDQRLTPAIDAFTQALDGAGEAPWIDDALERLIAAHEALGETEAAAAARAQRDARRDVR
ncbi:MAG: tetratricopeptide repeat protein [Myxococcales bacterium]|nr:tetratricopeptide repeat protein [Myxococcales bacterium]